MNAEIRLDQVVKLLVGAAVAACGAIGIRSGMLSDNADSVSGICSIFGAFVVIIYGCISVMTMAEQPGTLGDAWFWCFAGGPLYWVYLKRWEGAIIYPVSTIVTVGAFWFVGPWLVPAILDDSSEDGLSDGL